MKIATDIQHSDDEDEQALLETSVSAKPESALDDDQEAEQQKENEVQGDRLKEEGTLETTADSVDKEEEDVNNLDDIQIDHSIDWFGNTILHHAFAHDKDEMDLSRIESIISAYPESAYMTNQFGRLALHYAVDRIRFNIDGIKKLINSNPDGVILVDNEGKTPYDLAIKWRASTSNHKHFRPLLKLMLESIHESFHTMEQRNELRRIRYGNTHTDIHTYTHYTHYTHTYTYTYTHTYIHIHAYMHTHTHIHTQVLL